MEFGKYEEILIDNLRCVFCSLVSLIYSSNFDCLCLYTISALLTAMPFLERCCLETKRTEYHEVLDVTRILHMLQKRHIITSQLEAIVLADPGFSGRVDRLIDILMTRGPQVCTSVCSL